MILWTITAALAAPYGVPVDGYPTATERALLLWTNAARVDPEGFDEEYKAGYHPCGFADFLPDEQVPKAPMYLDIQLTRAARFHSEDMRDNGCFQHESCDGTDTFARIEFRGPTVGCVELLASRSFARNLAASILGADASDVSDLQSEEALRELANIVGGSVITALGGSDCRFSLGLPQLGRAEAAGDDTACILDAEGARLEVHCHRARAA